MRYWLLILFIGISSTAGAQHCPWDCTGFLMVRTNASREEMARLKPILVDNNKRPVVDTIYGTGRETYDSAYFMMYDDFKKYRTERIKLHHWYAYDTLLNFAEGHYVVHYNYCKYKWDRGGPVFIRINDPVQKNSYKYIEIPGNKRIHLHDLNTAIRIDKRDDILKDVEPMILVIKREDWGLKPL